MHLINICQYSVGYDRERHGGGVAGARPVLNRITFVVIPTDSVGELVLEDVVKRHVHVAAAARARRTKNAAVSAKAAVISY